MDTTLDPHMVESPGEGDYVGSQLLLLLLGPVGVGELLQAQNTATLHLFP